MKKKIRNVFVSHIHEDDSGIKQLKDLLTKQGFQLRDSSINSDKQNRANNPDYIKSRILAPAIQNAGVVIVYISPSTRDSKWVDWEIRHAHRLGKRIVGVWGYGAADCDLPQALEDYADAVVGWNSKRIAAAISGDINDWETAAGESRGAVQIKRYSCARG